MAVKGKIDVTPLKTAPGADDEEEERMERIRGFINSGQGQTMLHYMASVANERLEIEEGDLESEMHSLLPASRVVVQALQQEVAELQKGLDVVQVRSASFHDFTVYPPSCPPCLPLAILRSPSSPPSSLISPSPPSLVRALA
jgi:hypothetical protein